MTAKRAVSLVLAVFLLTMLFSETVSLSVQNSLQLCLQTLIPALYPYFVLNGMLIDCGIDLLFPSPTAAFIISLLCGYPLGTRTVCEMYQQNRLSQKQANALLLCTANTSPGFMLTIIGDVILESRYFGIVFLLIQTICATVLFLIAVPKKAEHNLSGVKSVSFIDALIDNLQKSTQQILFVCACTVIFGILFDGIMQTGIRNFLSLIALTELIHGVNLFTRDTAMQLAAVVGFSGISVLMQCAFFIKNADLKVRYLILGKICYGTWMPLLLSLWIKPIQYKIVSLSIFILTNTIIVCIIKHKGSEKNRDIFKRNRKMLRLLRARNHNHHERAGSLSVQRNH